jgi:hypothetical protein
MPIIQPIPFYAGPAQYQSGGTRYPRSISAIRKFAHGAGSALLAFAGADSLADSAAAAAGGAPPIVDFSSLDGIAQSLVNGGLSGPMQIMAAAFLFLTAGRCVARFLGLVAVTIVLVLYLKGATLEGAWSFIEQLAFRLDAARSAFLTADVA